MWKHGVLALPDPLTALCATAAVLVALVALYAVSRALPLLLDGHDHRARLADGTATFEDLERLLRPRRIDPDLFGPTALVRLYNKPSFAVAWIRAGEDLALLGDCYTAGLTDNECAAHLNDTHRITRSQVSLLAALSSPSP